MSVIASDETRQLPFALELCGHVIPAVRTVTGGMTLVQHINVPGVGSKMDPASYGPSQHPPQMMEKMAQIIALELVIRKVLPPVSTPQDCGDNLA
jgi:hypothetical protein